MLVGRGVVLSHERAGGRRPRHPAQRRPARRCTPAAGKVSRIRLLGDYAHTTRIAFVEFQHAEGALAALNCSGALLGEPSGAGVGKLRTPGVDAEPAHCL